MKTRKEMLLRLSAIQFAAWELHIYLDTHPNDKTANIRYRELEAQYQQLLSEFEDKYGPVIMPATGNEWLKGPWPWENKEVKG